MKLSFLALLCVAQAFSPNTLQRRTSATKTPLAMSVPLNQVDEMCIENVAEFCLEEAMECDIEEFEALVNQLSDQRAYHAQHSSVQSQDSRGSDDCGGLADNSLVLGSSSSINSPSRRLLSRSSSNQS